MALVLKNGTESDEGSKPLLFLDNNNNGHHRHHQDDDDDERSDKSIPKIMMTPPRESPSTKSQKSSHTTGSAATSNQRVGNTTTTNKNKKTNNEEITFLIEIVAASIPKRTKNRKGKIKKDDSSYYNNRGMHCTTSWIGPTNPSGRNRLVKVLHRTKTLTLAKTSSDNNGIDGCSSSPFDNGGGNGDGAEEEEEHEMMECSITSEQVFTVNDDSLFLFKTTMKQLVNAASVDDNNNDNDDDDDDDDNDNLDDTSTSEGSSSTPYKNYGNGGLRIDIFEEPLDMFTSVYSTVLANSSIGDKERNAIPPRGSESNNSGNSSNFRLVGSVYLSPMEILTRCEDERFECTLMENWRRIHDQQQQRQHQGSTRGGSSVSTTQTTVTPKRVEGGRLALRIRKASEFDVAFLKCLKDNEGISSNEANVALQTTLIQQGSTATTTTTTTTTAGKANNKPVLKPAQLITEMDENLLTATTSIKAINSIAPITSEGVRYLFSNDVEKRVYVKPYPDPRRVEDTTWFTEGGLQEECYKDSSNWIQAGRKVDQGVDGSGVGEDKGSGSYVGEVYLEVLECRGLPNTDAGGAVGNKTDAFISIVYGDIMVQTEVIDDSCSPMWMPWSSRAFVFQMGHPSTAIYIGVADYDIGPLEHECIGRVAIDMEKFHPGTLYTLTYQLYESSNLVDRGMSSSSSDNGEDLGTITIRLRVEIPNERKHLLKGWKAPERNWVNSQQWKSHRVAKYCVDGPHDEEVFEMKLFRGHINELLTAKKYLSYAVSDSLRSLIFWRGQVKVGNVWLPLHSAVVFYFSVHAVERPQLVPSFFLFGCGWIMIANMLQKSSQPNPWLRGHSFAHYWNVLTSRRRRTTATSGGGGGSNGKESSGKVTIRPNQGHKEASKLESKWKQRLADADAEYAKQAELDAKIKTISDDAIIRTKAKASGALVDPISAVAGAKLLPYQQRLSGYCYKVRYIRNVMNWDESVISFFITLILFASGCVALFIPWRFLLQWTSRLVVWGCLGPWMRIIDMFFHEEAERQKTKASKKAMKLFREQRKMAKILREHALKMKAFRVKLFGQFITRLPEYHLTRHKDVPLPQSYAEPYHSEEEINPTKFVPSQDLTGTMIPMTGQDTAENEARKQKEKECLIERYRAMKEEKPQLLSPASGDDLDLDEGFELVSTEDRVVCLHSAPSEDEKDPMEKTSTEMVTHTRCDSVRDVTISDKAIQLALEQELEEYKKAKPAVKTRWVFSAQVRMSLVKETVDDAALPKPALCNGNRNEMIEQMDDKKLLIEDDVQEEGVEIVPFLGSVSDYLAESDTPLRLENDSHVSVLYVKDDTDQGMDDIIDTINSQRETRDNGNATANAVKRIREKKAMSEID